MLGDLWEEASLLLLPPFLVCAKRMHPPATPCTSVSRTITAAGNLASLCVIHGGRAQLQRACSAADVVEDTAAGTCRAYLAELDRV